MALKLPRPHLGKIWMNRAALLSILFFVGAVTSGKCALQFDVFPGYDGVVPEAGWFPVVCEVRNDGPSFTAFFEITSGQFNGGQVRRVPLELPTNTRKRVVVPVFSSSRYGNWNFRLIDDRDKIRAEQLNIHPRKQIASEIPMVAALARTVSGVPVLPPIKPSQQELQPVAARLQASLFPDNPIALEGLDTLYLNAAIASELKIPQREALLAWLHGGGHLVVSVEQLSDLTAQAWLEEVLPSELTAVQPVKIESALQMWLQTGTVKLIQPSALEPPAKPSDKRRSQTKNVLAPNPFSELSDDPKFEQGEMSALTGKLRDGIVLAKSGEIPLVIQAVRGRGRLTLLAFSVEREPFISWKNRPWFWAKLSEIPIGLYQSSEYNMYGGHSTDGIFGSLIDSKQVRKLPLAWLLLLLVVYLVVIGPLDQFWLKKINRQMWTWLTFPAYVLIFSVLIYFIGFQLRAGDSEFNELQIVDILPRGEKAVLRGRTYASIYSPSNKLYPLASEQPFATLRGEFMSSYGGAEESSRATVIQRGNNFAAQVSVPVWTSQLFVSDWLQAAESPLKISTVREGNDWSVSVQNKLDRKLSETRIVVSNRVYTVGDIAARENKKVRLQIKQGTPLKDFTRQNGSQFFNAVQSRQHTFGNNQPQMNVPLSAMAASFSAQLNEGNGQYFISPDGFELSKFAERGDVIFLAWDEGHSLTKPLNQFTPRRSHRDTLLRLVVPNEINRAF
ncbi:MAG: hypothetical protein ABI042_16845 [Verrucomicrobiota bacterium]